MKIGGKIYSLMKKHQITQEMLADYTCVSQTKIHDIISGKTQKIDFHFMQKVCELFNVRLDYFADNSPKSNNEGLPITALEQKPNNSNNKSLPRLKLFWKDLNR